MAGRVKGDCGANSMEHSFALTHLIPIGLWVMVIGWHLGSERVHLRRVREKEFGRVGIFRDVEAGRMALAEFLDTRSDRPEIIGSARSGHVSSATGSGVYKESTTKKYHQANALSNRVFDSLSQARRAARRNLHAARRDEFVSFIDRDARQ